MISPMPKPKDMVIRGKARASMIKVRRGLINGAEIDAEPPRTSISDHVVLICFANNDRNADA